MQLALEGGAELVLFLPFLVQPIPVGVEGPPALVWSKIFTQNMAKMTKKIRENYGNCRDCGYYNRNLYLSLSC